MGSCKIKKIKKKLKLKIHFLMGLKGVLGCGGFDFSMLDTGGWVGMGWDGGMYTSGFLLPSYIYR